MIFRIKNVDMDGFCGREHHPEPGDVGKLVVPIKMEALFGDNCDFMLGKKGEGADEEIVSQEAEQAAIAELSEENVLLRCWTCVDSDGRLIELMDFEVELFRS